MSPTKKTFHTRTQHAVGQGGFHSAIVDDGAELVRYVYDCGSTNLNRLGAVISKYARANPSVDLLFLSHLDQDHVNGVDKLLDEVSVDTVVLPYLMPFERFLLGALAAATPRGATGLVTYSELLLSPARWLRARGVRRVVFVRGGGTPEPEPVAIEPGEGGGPRDDKRTDRVTFGRVRPVSAAEHPDLVRPRRGSPDVLEMESGPIYVRSRDAAAWVLVPYVHPEPIHAAQFVTAVARALKLRKPPLADDVAWLRALKKLVSSKEGRAKLARLYTKHLRRDRNLSSMCLYSGPVNKPTRIDYSMELGPVESLGSRFSYLPRPMVHDGVAWLGTGDAHLERIERRRALESFFARLLPMVATVVLPHHGSRHNITSSFIQGLPRRIWVAAYGSRNRYRHPDHHVMQLARTYGDAIRVTEGPSTEFTEAFGVE